MKKRKGRIWTDEQKQKQAERIRNQKPWLKSTGPKTIAGKRASAQNAIRHGYYSNDFKMMRLYLKTQKTYIATLRFMLKHDLFEDDTDILIRENELNKNPIKSIQNDTFGRAKNILKNTISRHYEEQSDEAIQNLAYQQHSRLLRPARNDNIPHSYSSHSSFRRKPESTPSKIELCDSLCPLRLCGETFLAFNPIIKKTRHNGRAFQNFQSDKIIQRQRLFRLPFS